MKKILAFILGAMLLVQCPSYAVFQPYIQLPSQTGQSGKVLGTDGSNLSWVAGGGGASLSADQTWTGQNWYANPNYPLVFSDVTTVPSGDDPHAITIFPPGSNPTVPSTGTHFGTNSTLSCGTTLQQHGEHLTIDQGGAPVMLVGQPYNPVGGYESICFNPEVTFANDIYLDSNPMFMVNTGIQLSSDGGNTFTGNMYPWHPDADPTCSISPGGTTCTATITLPYAGMRCSANSQDATPLGGILGEVTVPLPVSTTQDIVYTAASAIAGGGTESFSVTCD